MTIGQNILDLRKNEDFSQDELVVTEKQTMAIKKILKGFLISFIVLLVIDFITFIIVFTGKIGPFKEIKSDSNASYVIKKDGEL